MKRANRYSARSRRQLFVRDLLLALAQLSPEQAEAEWKAAAARWDAELAAIHARRAERRALRLRGEPAP